MTRALGLACLLLGCSSEPGPSGSGASSASTPASSTSTTSSTSTSSPSTSRASSSTTASASTSTGGASSASASTGSGLASTGAGGATGTGGAATSTTGNGGSSAGGGGVTGGGGASATTSIDSASSSAGGATSTGATSGGLGGSGGSGGTAAGYDPCPTGGSPCKIMPFGDSITDGFGVAGSYRVELFRLALAAGKDITFVGSQANGPSEVDGVPFPPNHEGHSGYTIEPETGRSGISPLVSTVMPQYSPDIVLLMIGTNDAIDDIDMPNAPARLGALIDSIYDELPEVLIIVARPVPSREDDLNVRLLTYGEAIPAVVQARADAGRHIGVVDMYPVLADQPDYKTDLLQDTWHPNAAGHVLLGAEWFSALEAWW